MCQMKASSGFCPSPAMVLSAAGGSKRAYDCLGTSREAYRTRVEQGLRFIRCRYVCRLVRAR